MDAYLDAEFNSFFLDGHSDVSRLSDGHAWTAMHDGRAGASLTAH